MAGFTRTLLLSALVANSAGAQKVLLQLRPHVDDTLRMELEQVTEMSGAAVGAPGAAVITKLKMFSRAIVEGSAPIASLILAVTDSVSFTSNDANARALGLQAKNELEGRQMRLQLWPDGTVTLNDGAASVPREVSDLVSVMPASFPSKPVAIGESWQRSMPVPSGDALGIPAGSVMKANFRLDSTSADGNLAYVTMKGVLAPAAKPANDALSGSVNGTLVVNRKRGWLASSHFELMLKSALSRNGKVDETSRFSVKVTQTMKTMRPQVAAKR
jgi:hypothetical protein